MISTIYIDGMRSVHCARAVYTSLAGVAGIDRADVSIGQAVIEHAGVLDGATVADAVARVGYAVRVVVTERRLPVHVPVDVPVDVLVHVPVHRPPQPPPDGATAPVPRGADGADGDAGA
ncbi:MAG: heavy-metal-associated domain-containing protein [Gemmatimonadaceae bacterium]|nr:heavy-metal-associated domain-containing protein [Gemmatimonadaceae bacterium]